MLFDHQEVALRHALQTDADGLFHYSTVLYSDIKKSAKSTVAAAVALWRAWQVDAADGWGSIYIVANDLKQADSRVAYYLRRAIELNTTLRDRCTIRTGSYKVTLPHKTFIEAIPIDPTGEAGSNADLVVFSELWGAGSKAQAQMWTEMTLPPNKFGRSQRWVETYAGIEGKSDLLARLYDQTVKDGRTIDPVYELYDNPIGRVFALWNTQPRLPWQTDAYYDQERAALTPNEFDRVHRNQWSNGSNESFLPHISLWDACGQSLPLLSRREPLVVSLDAAKGRANAPSDCFAMVVVGKMATHPGLVCVRYVKTWQARAGDAIDFAKVEDFVYDFCLTYGPLCVTYDGYQLAQMAGNLARKGVYTIEFSQQARRLKADKQLYDLILSKGIAHDPAMPGADILRQHIQNADQKPDDEKLRIVKRSEALKIDLTVACSQAADCLLSDFNL